MNVTSGVSPKLGDTGTLAGEDTHRKTINAHQLFEVQTDGIPSSSTQRSHSPRSH
jgi:hypothetical protein